MLRIVMATVSVLIDLQECRDAEMQRYRSLTSGRWLAWSFGQSQSDKPFSDVAASEKPWRHNATL